MLASKKNIYTLSALLLLSMSNQGNASPKVTEQNNGTIQFFNDNGAEKCSIIIPETSQMYNFGANNQYCENNMVSTFLLSNVPSATLIQFYADESCTEAKAKENFFFKLKTVKAPTTWTLPQSIDSLRIMKAGFLIPNKDTRIEEAFVGSDFANKNLNEHLSCVYIERSQPVN